MLVVRIYMEERTYRICISEFEFPHLLYFPVSSIFLQMKFFSRLRKILMCPNATFSLPLDGHPDWLTFEKKKPNKPNHEMISKVPSWSWVSGLCHLFLNSLYDRDPCRSRTDETAVENDSGQHFTREAALRHSVKFYHPYPLPGRIAYFLRVVYKWFPTKPTPQHRLQSFTGKKCCFLRITL